MPTSVTNTEMPEVLEIKRARERLPTLVRRAVEDDEVTHVGVKAADQAVVVSAQRYRRGEEAIRILESLDLGPIEAVREAVAEIVARRAATDPFASLRTLIATRRGHPVADAPARRLVATSLEGPEEDLDPESLTWERMAAVGGGAPVRTHGRRPLPASRRRGR